MARGATAALRDDDDTPDLGVKELINDFSRYLIREERSPRTVTTYQWALRDFDEYLATQRIVHPRQISRRALEAWQDRLIDTGMKSRSRSLAHTAVRQFLKWAADHDYCDGRLANWLASVRVKRLTPKPLPPDDLEKLRAYFTPRPKEIHQLRNRALFWYFLSTGARVSEALRVPRSGFERAIVQQKGGTDKLLVIPESTQRFVREYLQARTDGSTALFVTHPEGHPLQPAMVRDVWRSVARKAGVKHFTTHQLRHTFATELLERGVDALVVADLLGHHGMATIRNYAQVRESTRLKALTALEELIGAGPPPPDERLASPLRFPKKAGRPKLRVQNRAFLA